MKLQPQLIHCWSFYYSCWLLNLFHLLNLWVNLNTWLALVHTRQHLKRFLRPWRQFPLKIKEMQGFIALLKWARRKAIAAKYWKTTRCEAEASCCSLLSYLGNRKIEQNRSDVTMLTIKMFISNLKFFVLLTNISTNTSKRKLCFRDISWNHTIRKSFRDSFIFRINCAAWNELCFSQRCS